MTKPVRTTCPYCGVGCGVLVTPEPGGGVTVHGDPDHPANQGRLCSKGAALAETVGFEERLLSPEIRGARVSWEQALDHVADRFRRIIDAHGPDAVAFYVSGQLLTEDYYVANKLMKGYIGRANIDTNSRLCMSSSVAGHQRAFGADLVPGCYEDLDDAELVVLVGSNTAWCHPVLYQRLRAARERAPGRTLVVVDPRRTASCELADLHLAIRPGTDTVLFNGLLVYLFDHGRVDYGFLEAHGEGYAASLEAARASAPSIPAVARACGVPEAEVADLYHRYARTPKAMTLYSQGVNQSSSGTDKVNAIINCHLATGRIGHPGMGPFSLTGQPNAMGGREVGGLANQLAAHMGFDPNEVDRVARFWRAPRVANRPGLKAVELFHAVEAGAVKALWIMATNPVVSLPDADQVRRALGRCELVVLSDCIRATDTAAFAHVLLPASAWGEKDGTVTNSERRISRQRPFRASPGDARPDWWIVSQVARRMGYEAAFPYRNAAAVFNEHARLSGFENDGQRVFDLSGLTSLEDADYDALAPVQWPVTAAAPRGTPRLFGDGRFSTPSGRGRLVPITPRPPARATESTSYPLVLNTGRVRDHWHTLTRTGLSPRLSAHIPEPYAELHPRDALARAVREGALVRVVSRWGAMLARARISDAQQPGSVFVPMHWGETFARAGRVGAVVNPDTDPISGQPEFKHTPVEVEPYGAAWYGFVLARIRVGFPEADYRVRVRARGHWRYELAGARPPDDWAVWAHHRLSGDCATGEWLEYRDARNGVYRAAWLVDGRLEACGFFGTSPQLPPRAWLTEIFQADMLDPAARASLLAGVPGQGRGGAGPTVCCCLQVGRDTLVAAIRSQGCTTLEALGVALGAGTQCGSCVPELRALLAEIHGKSTTIIAEPADRQPPSH
ncbi:MAG: molybdopterin-dependent oxidoreductase [Gammaproteobacteria bacterium]